MNFAQARSCNNGIDFYISAKNITISSTRNSKGEVVIEKHDGINIVSKSTKSNFFVSMIVSMFLVLMFKLCNNFKIEVIILLAIMWIGTFLFYFAQSKNPKNSMMLKYHAAEHKALNYLDKYNKATLDCNEIMKMPYISIRCGSTILVVLYVLITLSTLGILFIPWIVLKILWCIICIFITFFLWATDKCNFLQKLLVKEPSLDEVEVATLCLWEYVKTRDEKIPLS